MTAKEEVAKHEECQYLDLAREVIDKGEKRDDRTGVGTKALFGRTMRFSLMDETLPLFTTKRTYWVGIAHELLWFLSGSTDSKELEAKRVNIWKGNTSEEFLEKKGLGHYERGEIGPGYGFQWRHWGATYEGCRADYSGKGVDQITEAIDKIMKNPTDRRILVSAWNPSAIPQMALPPCHYSFQFFVHTETKELSCMMNQRSADLGLGVPFNVASYALLTHMVAHVTGLKAREFFHVMGDCHVYLNHIEAIQKQLERTPYSFPKLRFKRKVDNIDDFCFEDFDLVDYQCHPTIKMEMAV